MFLLTGCVSREYRIRQAGSTGDTQMLANFLRDGDADVRSSAAQSLGRLATRDSHAALALACGDEIDLVREAVATGCGSPKTSEYRSCCENLLVDRSTNVRVAVLVACEAAGTGWVLEGDLKAQATKALTSADWREQIAAASFLASTGDFSGSEVVILKLRPGTFVLEWQAAVKAASNFKGDSAVADALSDAVLVESDGERRNSLLDALSRVTGRSVSALAHEAKSNGSERGKAAVWPREFRRSRAGGVTVAISDLQASGVSASDAAFMTNVLREEVVASGRGIVVEKGQMDRILAEQAFQQTGCTTQDCVVKLGKVLNVRRIVVGTFGRFMGKFFVNARVVEVETGQVLAADTARGVTSEEVEAAVRALGQRLVEAF